MSRISLLAAVASTALMGAPLVAGAAIAPNSLRVVDSPTHVELSWQDGTAPYGVYRAETPEDVTADPWLIATTTETSHADDVAGLDGSLYFYKIADPPLTEPSCELNADLLSLTVGETTRLVWTSTEGVTATLNGAPVPLEGERMVTPATSLTYTLAVLSDGIGTEPALCEVDIEVVTPPCTATTPCQVTCGTGSVDDILTGQKLLVDGPDMVHVLILPEGYRPSELASGVFARDTENWIDEWAPIEPYRGFRDAFCIWRQPVPSNDHIEPAAPQTADTAFLVPITDDRNGVASNIPLDGPTAERVWATVEAGFPFEPTSYWPAGGRTHLIAKNLIVVVLVYDPDIYRSGLSGRARRLERPSDATQRISAAFAHNRPHEFSHAFSRARDEYIEDCCGPMCGAVTPPLDADDVTNVVCSPDCADSPWAHLMAGTPINPATDELVGSFGVADIGYHSELKCLMNGTHDNAAYYGGDGRLRVYNRFCNFCREMHTFRLFERIHVLDDPVGSWDTWKTDYRAPFFSRFGFQVPGTVPQQNSAGDPIFEACGAGKAMLPWLMDLTREPHGSCDIDDDH